MHIEAITEPRRFADLEPAWRDIYRSDPESHIFLSHAWLDTWFAMGSVRWVILAAAAEKGGDLLGFFPLRMRRPAGDAARPRLVPAGSSFADFTGFICRPEVESAVASAFGTALLRSGVGRADLTNLLLGDRRSAHFVAAISRGGARCIRRVCPGNGDGVDQSVAPYARLPSSWDDYANRQMSANSRQKARRFLRKLDGGGTLAVTHATAESLGRDVTILLRLWLATFADRKGGRAEQVATVIGRRLTAFHRAGLMDLCVLWQDGTPIAAHALYADPVKQTIHFAVGACDKSVQSPPPSFLLHCYSIRRAIAEGVRIYDFLRGNEPYKYSFADGERRLRNVTVDRPPEAVQAGRRTAEA